MIDESDRDSDTFITFGCSIAVFALIFSKQIKSQGEIPCNNTNKIIAYVEVQMSMDMFNVFFFCTLLTFFFGQWANL